MNFVKKIYGILNKFEAIVLVGFLGLLVVLSFLQVVLRNVFSAGFLWADILLRHLMLWIGFLGAAIATSENRHINIDALRRFLSPMAQRVAGVITDLFASVVCGFLANASLTFVRDEMQTNTTLFAGIPGWCGEVIIPVGFALLSLHFVFRAILRAEGEAEVGPDL